jgi:hypothetical protein
MNLLEGAMESASSSGKGGKGKAYYMAVNPTTR